MWVERMAVARLCYDFMNEALGGYPVTRLTRQSACRLTPRGVLAAYETKRPGLCFAG
jgi:hypothetical protein